MPANRTSCWLSARRVCQRTSPRRWQADWQDAGSGEPFEWDAWASIDALNRLFVGSPQVYSGITQRLWSVRPTKVNLPPNQQDYQPGINFKSNHEEIWGVG